MFPSHDRGGDVTIGGVTATESKLHIKQTSTNYALRIQNSTNTTNSYNGIFIAGVDENTTSYPLFIKGNSDTLDESAGNVKFVVRADGNTGVGTASPSEALEINKSGANLKVVSDANVYLSLDSTQTNGDEWQIFNANSGATSTLQFKNIDQSALVMLMEESGNIGVNTATPDTLMHIHKATAGTVDSNANAQLTIENNSHAGLQFLSPNSANNIIYFGDVNDNDVGYIAYLHGSNEMEFLVDTSVRFKLDANSRISLGNNDSSGNIYNTIFGY